MFPVMLPLNKEHLKEIYKNILTIKISSVGSFDVYFNRHIVEGDKEVLELHFFDTKEEWYIGSVVEYDNTKTGVALLYDLLSYLHYIVINKSNLICNYSKYTKCKDNENLDIKLWFNGDRSKLLHDLITVDEFKVFDRSNYKFTHPLQNVEEFLKPLTIIPEEDVVNG